MRFEDVGPLQVLVVGFDADADFSGEIIAELERLISRGTIRVIDLRFLTALEDGTVVDLELDPLSEEERAGFGQVIDSLRALAGQEESTGTDAAGAAGLGPADIDRLVNEIAPGESVGILLFEHTWATQLKAAIRGVGGRMIAQGLLTPEAALMVGAEVAAIADAEAAVELSAAISGAAMLDAAAAIAAAEDIKTAAAVDAIRALIAAEIVVDTAATAALEALVEAELISAAAVDIAAQEVLATAAEAEQALAEISAGGGSGSEGSDGSASSDGSDRAGSAADAPPT
jgi:hypothetical protein